MRAPIPRLHPIASRHAGHRETVFEKETKMWNKILQTAAHALWVVTFMSFTVSGQINTATVTGVVTDPTHAVIPNAQVRITSEGMGVVKTTVSNTEGRYSFTFLLPGTYELSVQAKGFGTFERKGISVQAAQVVNFDCEL